MEVRFGSSAIIPAVRVHINKLSTQNLRTVDEQRFGSSAIVPAVREHINKVRAGRASPNKG